MHVKLNLKHKLHFRFMQWISGTVYILATNMPYGLFNLKKIGNLSGTFLRTTQVTVSKFFLGRSI